MIKLVLQIAFIVDTLIEALIIVRVLLSIFSANLSNMYVAWVFSASDICISPFTGITADTLVIDNFQISITPVVALVFFAIVGFVLSELLKAFRHD
ncbi:YggT family protein [bacterium]|nr:YggT family protein [bacterium]